MYTCIHGVYMWEAEPRLYWRLKVNGKWTWKAAELVDYPLIPNGTALAKFPHPEGE